MLTIVIDGLPVAWAAHSGYGRKAFNPRFKEREYYRWQIKSYFNQTTPWLGPVKLEYQFHMPIPKGTSKAKKLQMLNNKIRHCKRPDLDNLNKFLSDCLKTIVMEDDSQVVELYSEKIYSETPKTVIKFDQIEFQVD